MPQDRERPLNQISTLWLVVSQARSGSTQPIEAVIAARHELLERYRHAVHRYLLGALRDPHAADEIAQEFTLRFLRGNLDRADRERGRFRDFVKGVLFHLLADYHRQHRRQPEQFPAAGLEPDALAQEPDDPDQRFLESWRDDLLDRAWKKLEQIEHQTGTPLHTVLRYRAEHLETRSAQMAEHLSGSLGKPVSADWVRQVLHRARDKFADLLLGEVEQSLQEPTAERLEEELIDLGLLTYCQPALQRYSRKSLSG
jgi:RNA polymerase sigma factor (sigma-70 family)